MTTTSDFDPTSEREFLRREGLLLEMDVLESISVVEDTTDSDDPLKIVIELSDKASAGVTETLTYEQLGQLISALVEVESKASSLALVLNQLKHGETL